ncbi:MAG: C69 family dipeptidase [Candidatus Marinimicrobia bacterium]|nr:C69 family dipeptidase [Candidatus Neomarinimicrobiota bacterium]
MKRYIKIAVLGLLIVHLYGQDGFNCFSIIAGKDCTVDGSVLFGHNEDDGGDQIVNMYKVPRLKHTPDEIITLKNGGKCQQVALTNAYIWLEMPGMEFSDGYLNEHNVVIASDNCPSKEDQPELTDGGIGYWLRRLMAERAASAREAVKIGGQLIEKYGYTASGRTYCIADPHEAWVMCVVNGKHWVAQRVPDDKVMIIPNYYMIQEIDLSDTLNFVGSDDIIEYAISRGWYNPQKDGKFNYREAYGVDWSINHQHNINRQWGGLRLIAKDKFGLNDHFPFAVKPKKKIGLEDVFAVLRDHYEGTEMENENHGKTPHDHDNRPICTLETQYGFVAQLSSGLPREIAGVMWYAPVQPCLHPFVPVYLHTQHFPSTFAYEDYKSGLKLHFYENYDSIRSQLYDHSFQIFARFSLWVNEDYYGRSVEILEQIAKYQLEILDEQEKFRMQLLQKIETDVSNVQNIVTDYSNKNLRLLNSFQLD